MFCEKMAFCEELSSLNSESFSDRPFKDVEDYENEHSTTMHMVVDSDDRRRDDDVTTSAESRREEQEKGKAGERESFPKTKDTPTSANLLMQLPSTEYRDFDTSSDDDSSDFDMLEKKMEDTDVAPAKHEENGVSVIATRRRRWRRREGSLILFTTGEKRNDPSEIDSISNIPHAPRVRDRGVIFSDVDDEYLPTCGASRLVSRLQSAAAFVFNRLRVARSPWANRMVCANVTTLTRVHMRVMMEDARLQQRDSIVCASVSSLGLVARRKRRNVAYRSPSVKQASRVLRRLCVCSACSAPLFKVQDIRTGRDQERVRVMIEDSRDTICFAPDRSEEPFLISELKVLRQVPWRAESIWLRNVSCKACGVFLGIRVDRYCHGRNDPDDTRDRPADDDDDDGGMFSDVRYSGRVSAASRFHMSQNGFTVVPLPPRPRERSDSTIGNGSDAEENEDMDIRPNNREGVPHSERRDDDNEDQDVIRNETFRPDRDLLLHSRGAQVVRGIDRRRRREEVGISPTRAQRARSSSGDQGFTRVDRYFFGVRYIRVQVARTREDATSRVPICCKRCYRALSYTDQLLCCERRWSFEPNSAPESACYLNSLNEDHVVVSDTPYIERLAQGPFEMADVSCVCGVQIGYKFVRDHSPALRNFHQQGRYGLVVSRLCVRR